jgi:hypothetical protein
MKKLLMMLLVGALVLPACTTPGRRPPWAPGLARARARGSAP